MYVHNSVCIFMGLGLDHAYASVYGCPGRLVVEDCDLLLVNCVYIHKPFYLGSCCVLYLCLVFSLSI